MIFWRTKKEREREKKKKKGNRHKKVTLIKVERVGGLFGKRNQPTFALRKRGSIEQIYYKVVWIFHLGVF